MADPIELPSIVGWEEVEFDPVVIKETERMQGRRTETLRGLHGWWKARYVPGFLGREDFGRMDSFMMKVDGDGDYFRAHDPFRPRPILEDTGQPLSGTKAGGGAFTGTTAITGIVNSRTIDLSGFPAGFKLSEGDYVEFRMSALLVSLHRINFPRIADAGGLMQITFNHALDLEHFTTSATANFEKPSCIMQIDAGSYSGVKARRQRRPTFTATEVFPGGS